MRSVEVVLRDEPRPVIRVRPVPQSDPPFDDELSSEIWAPAHQLAFAWPTRERPGGPTTPAAPCEHVAGGPGQGGQTGVGAQALSGQPAAGRVARARAAGGASGDAKLAVRRFVAMCVEVLNGYRPAAHLRRLALPMEAAGVVAQGVSGARRVAELRRAARGGSRRAMRPGPVAVLRIRLCEPRPGAVEAAVLLITGERTWAMAVRLELHQQDWAATVLRLI
jgi:hypothetical protein